MKHNRSVLGHAWLVDGQVMAADDELVAGLQCASAHPQAVHGRPVGRVQVLQDPAAVPEYEAGVTARDFEAREDDVAAEMATQ
jgi:hypothetical protein